MRPPRVSRNNRFFMVRLSVTNNGSAEAMVPAMTVTDAKGKSFSELSNGDQVPQWLGLLRPVRPGRQHSRHRGLRLPAGRLQLRIGDETETRIAM